MRLLGPALILTMILMVLCTYGERGEGAMLATGSAFLTVGDGRVYLLGEIHCIYDGGDCGGGHYSWTLTDIDYRRRGEYDGLGTLYQLRGLLDIFRAPERTFRLSGDFRMDLLAISRGSQRVLSGTFLGYALATGNAFQTLGFSGAASVDSQLVDLGLDRIRINGTLDNLAKMAYPLSGSVDFRPRQLGELSIAAPLPASAGLLASALGVLAGWRPWEAWPWP